MRSSSCRALLAGLVLALTAVPASALEFTLFFGRTDGGELGDFGYKVRNAGDLNGDGINDLVAGAPFDSKQGLNSGRAFVWFGGQEMTGAPDLILDDSNGQDFFGFAVAGVGDVDNDGFDDLAIGAPGADRPAGVVGVVYLYRGGTNMDATVDRELLGTIGGERFGWSIAPAGDMDRDGTDDFVVGAPYNDAAGIDVGRAYLFVGENSMSTIGPAADRIYSGEAGGGPTNNTNFEDFAPDAVAIQGPGFGFSVCDMHDFRGDGRAAIAVGAPGQNGAQGRAYLFVASSSTGQLPSATPLVTFTNDTSNEEFGWAVASGGFIDTDGNADLLISAPGTSGNRGTVHVFEGAASPPATDAAANFERFAGVSGDRFGHAVAGVGDAQGGARNWIVGAPRHDTAGLDAGRVYLYDGTNTSPTTVGPVNGGGAALAQDQWGFSVDGLFADLDGDGLDDFLVGAPTGNAATNSVLGVMALVSSGDRIVATPTLRLETATRTGTDLQLDFSATGLPGFDDAVLSSGGRELARLGAGIWPGPRGLSARIPIDAVAQDQVELWWNAAGQTGQASFVVTTVLVRRAALLPPMPNPFNPRTTLSVDLPAAATVRVRILDLRGRTVRELFSGELPSGVSPLRFDGTDDTGRRLGSGSYIAVMETGDLRDSQRLMLVQ